MPAASRILFLARIALDLPPVLAFRRFLLASALSAAAGLAAALATVWLLPAEAPSPGASPETAAPGAVQSAPGTPRGERPPAFDARGEAAHRAKDGGAPSLPITAGIAAAAITGAALQLLALRRERRAQADGFARMARRLGEERTARAELKAAVRALAASLSRPARAPDQDTGAGLSPGRSLLNGGGTSSRLAPRAGVGADPPQTGRPRDASGDRARLARAAALFAGTDLDLARLAFAGPCAEVIEEYRRLAGPEREILYIEDGGGDWLAAPMDRALVVLMLRELLDNVFAHAEPWSRITVTTEPVPGAIVLRVRDDGRGMPGKNPEPGVTRSEGGGREPAAAGRDAGASSPASQAVRHARSGRPADVPAPERAERHGSGLGLILVRTIVEAHGGSIRTDSERGRGTSVTLRFPTHS